MSPLLVNNIGLLVAGLATLFVPLCSTHGLLITYCVVWGGFIGEKTIVSKIIIHLSLVLQRFTCP